MDSANFKLRPLNSENFYTWLTDIKVLLMDRACWSFIDGSEPPFNPESASRKEVIDYNTRKNRAYTTIYYSIEEPYRKLLGDTSSGKEAFEILHQYFH